MSNDLYAQVSRLNDDLRGYLNNDELAPEIVNAAIAQRQALIERLFSAECIEWTNSNRSRIEQLKQDIDAIDRSYQQALESVKKEIQKLQRNKKGVNAYKKHL